MYVRNRVSGRGFGQAMICQDGTQYTSMGGCDDGSVPVCSPSSYTLTNSGPGGTYACVNQSTGQTFLGAQAPSVAAVNASLCPIGAVCNIIPGISNTYVYIGAAVLGTFLLLAVLRK